MGENVLMLNSNDYDAFIESNAKSVMYSLKSALLSREEKDLIEKALFLFQKDTYESIGKLTEAQRVIISEIADKLNLR